VTADRAGFAPSSTPVSNARRLISDTSGWAGADRRRRHRLDDDTFSLLNDALHAHPS